MIIINTKFQEKLTSKALNDKIDLIVGSNARMFGFEATKASDTSISLPPGRCVITGAFIEEDAATRIIEIDPSMLSFGKLYLQMTYTHVDKRVEFTISNAESTDETALTIATINMANMKIISIDVAKALLSLKDMSVYIDEVIQENIALVEEHAKQYTDNQVQLVTETGIPKLVVYPYEKQATVNNQTKFDIPYEQFDKDTDTLILAKNSAIPLRTGFSITNPIENPDNSITKGYITLTEGVSIGSWVQMYIFKNVPMGTEGAVAGAVLAINSVPSNRVQGLDDMKQQTKTYTELALMVTNKTLVPGTQYVLSDYRTKYQQPDTLAIKEMAVERLVLTAISDSTFAKVCSSLDYPQDTIHYDFSLNLCEDGTTSRTGFILRRIDESPNVSTNAPLDWRTMLWARYLPNPSQYLIGTTLTNYSVWTSGIALPNVLYKSGNAIYKAWRFDTAPSSATDSAFFIPVYQDITVGAMLRDLKVSTTGTQDITLQKSATYKEYLTFMKSHDRITIGATIYGSYNPKYLLPNNVFMGDVMTCSFGSGCYSNTFFGYCYSCDFGSEFDLNTFLGDTMRNSFGSNCFRNIFGNNCNYNSFGSSCYDNTFEASVGNNIFGGACYNNILKSGCGANTFGANCYSNIIGRNSNSNMFMSSFYNNILGTTCCNNIFGVAFNASVLADNCSGNVFGSDCHHTTFGTGCASNIFGANCNNNTFGANCGSNTFGSTCYSNNFVSSCCNNSFAGGCHHNTFGDSCNDNYMASDSFNNTFGNGCGGNNLSCDCSYNIFGTVCNYNHLQSSVNGNTFGNNKANLLVKFMRTKNISAVTALESRDYTTTIEKRSDGYIVYWSLNSSNVIVATTIA